MENFNIYSKLISLEEQLETLERAKKRLIEYDEFGAVFGLCVIISENLPVRFLGYSGTGITLVDLIPLFTRKNALNYCNGRENGAYWWPRRLPSKELNNKPRLEMLNWMIELIKKEINKQK